MQSRLYLRWGLFVALFELGGLAGVGISLRADDWPQWLGPQRDAIWRETEILDEFPSGGPNIRWRTKIGGGYTGPAVASGRVYVTDRQLSPSAKNPADPFARGTIAGAERVLCLDEKDGRILWERKYDSDYTMSYPAGPRTTPLIWQEKVYSLGAEGNLLCLDTQHGTVLWSRDLKKDYDVKTPMWGFAGHPLVDGQKLVCLVGGKGSVAVAFDKDTGKELWRALDAKEPGYAPPMIYTFGGRRQLILWHPEAVNGLDPETGRVYWSHPFAVRSGLSIPTPRQHGNLLFLTAFYDGSRMFRFDGERPSLVWQSRKASERDTDALHSIISTPFVEGDYIYGVCSYGQLRCLKASNGERVWETLRATTPNNKEERWANAFIIKNGDRFFLFNEKGDLIIGKLTPDGYHEISRAHLLEPTGTAQARSVLWSHPAFANRHMYARNDKEIISVSLAAKP